jgi:hypothetical protein
MGARVDGLRVQCTVDNGLEPALQDILGLIVIRIEFGEDPGYNPTNHVTGNPFSDQRLSVAKRGLIGA